MHSEGYTTHSISKNEFQFFSEGKAGRFELRIYVTLIDPDENLYNLGFGIWDPVSLLLDDTRELRNGDTDKILATVGLKALEFLSENPFANLVAVGSVSSGKLAIRTRKYQMGINANYEFLSQDTISMALWPKKVMTNLSDDGPTGKENGRFLTNTPIMMLFC